MMMKAVFATVSLLVSPAVAGPNPPDGVSGVWKVSYGEGESKTVTKVILGRHKNVVCGFYMAEDAGTAAGYFSLALAGMTAVGPWTESLQMYGKTELTFAGDKVKGGWTESPSETKLIPLAGSYTGPTGTIPGKLGGKWKYKSSGGETCTMRLAHTGDAIVATGTFDSDDSDCGTWTGTLRGNLIVGEWKTTNKAQAAPVGNFYVIVSGSKDKPWMIGMEGSQGTDGKPSCDSIGRINWDIIK
jgi:hypothetical protein